MFFFIQLCLFSSSTRLSTFTRLGKLPLALKPPLETSRFPFSANILSAFRFTSVKKNAQSLTLVDLFHHFADTGSCGVNIAHSVREINSTITFYDRQAHVSARSIGRFTIYSGSFFYFVKTVRFACTAQRNGRVTKQI